jgi:hypothetical protein
MPSKTRRKYRGGDNLSNCEKWVKANNLDDEKDKCKQMEKEITFPTPGLFSSGPPPVTPRDIGVYSKGTKLNFGNWEGIYDGLFKPSAPAPVVASSYVPPQGRQLPVCNAYDRNTGKNVFKTSDGKYTERCESSQLPKCTQWKSIGEGMDKKWATTGPNGEFCNVAELPMDNNLNFTRSKIDKQRDEVINMDRDNFPLKRYSTTINYGDAYRYNQYNGGKRSRRKSRKSRR